jgi:ribosomal protein S18 acetylase RimI-like enzyme
MDSVAVSLVVATPQHFDAILRIERASSGGSIVALTHGHALGEALERGHSIAVALIEREVAGWVWFATDMGRGGEEVGQIFRIAVGPQHAGAGVGRALIEYAQAALAGRGVTRVRLTLDAEDEGARAFFQRLGYAVDAVMMERAL